MELNEYANETKAPEFEEIPPRFWGMARLMAQVEPLLDDVDRTDPPSVGEFFTVGLDLWQQLSTRLDLSSILGLPQGEEAKTFTGASIAAAISLALACQYTLEIITRELSLEEE